MRKEECVNVFNVKLREFISDLIRVYPTDDDLKKFKTSINMLLVMSDSQIIKIYNEYVYTKYKTQIFAKDEEFFMKHDYNDELNNSDYNDEFTEQLIDKIKSYWCTMTDDNKTIVWTYFTLLTKLCEKYYII
tara:strand:+ start:12459 stop:12854 length:396 start_codon:yes stop_codon:yes gene_type:complete